jgi:hypothetical protein
MKTSTAIFYMLFLYIPVVAAMYIFVFYPVDRGRFSVAFSNPFDRHQDLPEVVSLAVALISIGVIGFHLDIFFLLLPLLYYWYWDYRKRKVDFNYLLLAWVAIVPLTFAIKFHYYHQIETSDVIFQSAIWLRILVAAVVTCLSLYKLAFSGFSAKI